MSEPKELKKQSTLETLPPQFVRSMRVLFDIMDDKHTGYVNFSDIENRWRQDDDPDSQKADLPKGVIESLQKVTPPNGMLSFERFCAGLKICLLRRNQVEVAPPRPQQGPPKPPRVGIVSDKGDNRQALQTWQSQERLRVNRGTGDGKPAGSGAMQVVEKKQQGIERVRSRREPRRHTLQNGIDYNMLKRMKQIEQEKDVLMQGLSAIEKAREWYLKQVSAVQDKMKYLGRMGSHMEQWSEAQQERLELQRARVIEVNRHLATLTCSWERGGLPLHMNLAVHHYLPTTYPSSSNHFSKSNTTTTPPTDPLLNRLKQQNHLLTEEVTKKSERIAVLEREKAALIRELLQMRPNRTQEEAVF